MSQYINKRFTYKEKNDSTCWKCKYARDVEENKLLKGWCGCAKISSREPLTDFPNCEAHEFGWIYEREPCISFPQELPNISRNFMLRTYKVKTCPFFESNE